MRVANKVGLETPGLLDRKAIPDAAQVYAEDPLVIHRVWMLLQCREALLGVLQVRLVEAPDAVPEEPVPKVIVERPTVLRRHGADLVGQPLSERLLQLRQTLSGAQVVVVGHVVVQDLLDGGIIPPEEALPCEPG